MDKNTLNNSLCFLNEYAYNPEEIFKKFKVYDLLD